MTRACRLRFAALAILAFSASSCSRSTNDSQTINHDAAARCLKKIDEWRLELVKLDALQKEFDALNDQIRTGYGKATPEEKAKMRTQLGQTTEQIDQSQQAADRLFRGIIWDLDSVSSGKEVSVSLGFATTALRDMEGVRTPEVQQAMDALYLQLQILAPANATNGSGR